MECGNFAVTGPDTIELTGQRCSEYNMTIASLSEVLFRCCDPHRLALEWHSDDWESVLEPGQSRGGKSWAR